jgi:predicted TIM-barrel fold metal-dependent hydrolase
VGAPFEVYKDYLDKWAHADFDDWKDHHVSRWSPSQKDSYFPKNLNSKFWSTEGYDPEHGTAVTWDPNLRLKAIDQAMIACEVLIPDDTNTNDPPFGAGLATALSEGSTGTVEYPPALVRAGARAYNRWLAEFCSVDPDRLKGLIILGTTEDLGWCVEETRRAYESGLTAGLMLPLDYYQPYFHHPRYNVLWEMCTELDIPVVSHQGRGNPHYLGEDPWMQRYMFGLDLFLYAKRPVNSLIMGGVLERFPQLRLVVTEVGIDWVAPLLQGMDVSFVGWPDIQANRDVPGRVNFSMKPSEYWERQCYVCHSTCQMRAEFEGDAYESVPNMIFGADIGHHEGWWPVFGFPEPTPLGQPSVFAQLPVVPVEDAYRTIWSGLPAAKMMPYLEDNFFKAYPAFDRNALKAVTERIGPSQAEIGLI